MFFQDNMYDWLLDPLGRDEYLVFTDVATEVYRNGVGGDKPEAVVKKTVRFCPLRVRIPLLLCMVTDRLVSASFCYRNGLRSTLCGLRTVLTW
jgi:hypothetical protein